MSNLMGLNAVSALREADANYYWANQSVPYLLNARARRSKRWYGYAGVTSGGLIMTWALGPTRTPWVTLDAEGAMRLLAGWDHHPDEHDWNKAMAGARRVDPSWQSLYDIWDFDTDEPA